ncbi:MAG TPA: hypothetical protein VH186_19750 [Chloroflexia bacterium]|nr:hypothetical protein [Chloroflexia bacterium]
MRHRAISQIIDILILVILLSVAVSTAASYYSVSQAKNEGPAVVEVTGHSNFNDTSNVRFNYREKTGFNKSIIQLNINNNNTTGFLLKIVQPALQNGQNETIVDLPIPDDPFENRSITGKSTVPIFLFLKEKPLSGLAWLGNGYAQEKVFSGEFLDLPGLHQTRSSLISLSASGIYLSGLVQTGTDLCLVVHLTRYAFETPLAIKTVPLACNSSPQNSSDHTFPGLLRTIYYRSSSPSGITPAGWYSYSVSVFLAT